MGKKPVPVGSAVNGYEIVREIDNGEFAWSAEAIKGGKRYFLKQYGRPSRRDDRWYEKYVEYQREIARRIDAHARLRECVVNVCAVFEATHPRASIGLRHLYMVAEFLDTSKDLRRWFAATSGSGPSVAWDRRRTLACAFLYGLRQLHAAGIVHGDLKPENVLLIPAGSAYRVKLIDTDQSLLMDRVAPWHGHPGEGYRTTPGWSSPEHDKGLVPGAHSDVYTAGLILYELLTGAAPAAAERESPPAPVLLGPWDGREKVIGEALRAALEQRPESRPAAAELHDIVVGAKTEVPGPLRLTGPGNKTLVLTAAATLNKHSVEVFGPECRFWDPTLQCRVLRASDGRWTIVPNPDAVNATLVDGRPIYGPSLLLPGQVIAVGNPGKGTVKLPIKVGD